MGTGFFPGGKERPGRDADPSPPSNAVVMRGWSYISTPPMGRTACREPQCLYKGAPYIFIIVDSKIFSMSRIITESTILATYVVSLHYSSLIQRMISVSSCLASSRRRWMQQR